MGNGVAGLAQAYEILFTGALIFLAVALMLCLVRAIKGPRIADRVVAVNMMGTMVMTIIGILAVKMEEGYLADICLIYAMISFLAVVVLTKVYTGVFVEKKEKEENRMDSFYRRRSFPSDGNVLIPNRTDWSISL